MSYVEKKVQEIVEEMTNDKMAVMKIATCNSSSYGWSIKEHNLMPYVAEKLREKGFGVSSSVNWGVTDWVIVNPNAE